MSELKIPGIHHITAICGEPQRNVDFYAGTLGLRLVKKTVNFDDPNTYHLYYGDALGAPGTIMTFFAWILPPLITANARQGIGQITATPFLISRTALEYWVDRLVAADVDFTGPFDRFDDQVVSFADPDGLPLELVARDVDNPDDHRIRRFAGATLSLAGYERTAQLLTETMGLKSIGNQGSRFRFQVGEGANAAMIDVNCQPEGEPGRMGIGAVHHIAWRAPSREIEEQWRSLLAKDFLDVTPILDRNYFESIYFREPGGVLFEIATDPPGFTVDESLEELGTHLKLPSWLESRRERIEARLPDIRLPASR